MKHFAFLTLSIFTIFISSGQEKMSEEMRATYAKIFFANKEPIFENKSYQFKTEEYIETEFLNPIPDEKIIDECISLIKKNGKFKIQNEFEENKLYFKSSLSDKMDFNSSTENSLEIKESNLKYENGEKIELKSETSTSLSYQPLNLKIRTNKEIDSSQTISGSATFKIEYLTEYQKVKLSKANIGENFKIGTCEFKLINVVKNKVIVENLCKDKLDLNVINLPAKGKVIKSYSYLELMKLKKEDENVDLAGAFTKSNTSLYKIIYDIFEQNQEIKLEEFDKMMTIELLEGLKDSSKYLIIENVAPFDGDFILYTPVHSNKNFIVEYK